jgi:PAS domain S-box-containing protein
MKNQVPPFLANKISSSPATFRIGLIFGMIAYGIFGILDYYALPANYSSVWIIRYGFILPLLIISFLISYLQSFERYSKIILFVLLGLGQIGIIVMIGLSMPYELAFHTYYAGLIMLMLWAVFIFRVNYSTTIYIAISTVLLYNFTAFFVQNLPAFPNGIAMLLNNNFFLVSIAVLVVIGAQQFEKIVRLNSDFNTELIREKELLKSEKEKAEESEYRFKALHNASFGGIAIHDKGIIIECNQGLAEITGYDIDQLMGMDGLLLFSEEYRQSVMQNILAEYQKPYESIGLKRNGEKYPLRLEGRMIPYKGQQVRIVEFRDITAQKLAEKKLKDSEERYRLLFNSAADAIFIHNNEEGILAVNQTACERLGYTHAELILLPPGQWDIPEQRQFAAARIDILMQQGHNTFESVHQRKDGSTIPTEVNTKVITWDGKPAVMSTCRDITHRKQAEYALKESEIRLQKIIDTSPDGLVITDLNGTAQYLSPQCFKMWGFTESDDIIGQNVMKFVHPDYYEKAIYNITEMLKGNLTGPVEYQMLKKDGSVFFVEANANVLRDAHDNASGILYFQRDITERKKIEAALSESEAKFREMAELLPQIVFETDITGNLTYLNKQAYKLSGYPEEESLIGKSSVSFYIPEDRERAVENIKRSIAGTKSAISNEYTMMRKDGTTFNVLVYSNPVFKDSKPVGLRGIIVDISEIKMAHTEIKTLNEELEQRVAKRTEQLEMVIKEMESFSYSVSHDLRTPLRALDGFANILIQDYAPLLDDEGKRMLQIIIVNANKMGALIDDLLAFSRLSRQEMQYSPIDMHALAYSSFIELVPENQKIEFRIQPLSKATGDVALLRQVWLNFISNAIKFTSKKSNRVIEVGMMTEDSENIYFVKDNGAGFNMDYSNKLFAVFQRLHSPREFEGTGIGLSIVQRIIQRHGGRVWGIGKVNEGATFYFTIPKIK